MALISRRTLLAASLLPSSLASASDARPAFEQLERRHGGRLGVAVLGSDGRLTSYRGDERFPMCSTFKFAAAAFVLARVDRQEESLARRVMYGTKDLVAYSPITEKHAGKDGLTIGELCAAAVTLSDNTAANLLLGGFGGPAALTAHIRALGDGITRLDRGEPELNEATPGDPRDTTTPIAMLGLLRQTILGGALSGSSREQLTAWLVGCKTGDKRLRAGMPRGWRVGDKTASGDHNASNDIAVIWPTDRDPMIVTAYYVGSSGSAEERNAVLADVGRLAAAI